MMSRQLLDFKGATTFHGDVNVCLKLLRARMTSFDLTKLLRSKAAENWKISILRPLMLGLYRCALSFGSSSTLQTEVMELRGRVKISLSVQLCGMLARVCIDTNDLRVGAY